MKLKMSKFSYQTAAIVMIIFAILQPAFAQTNLDRGKAAYEAMTPSQQRAIREAVVTGGQIRLQSQSLTRSDQGADGLLFLKGLNCKEWNANELVVRQNWLTQYMDATKSRDFNPMTSNTQLALSRVDEHCQANPLNSVEIAIASAYRKFEADAIKFRAANEARSAAVDEKLALERREALAAQEARENTASRVENNPLFTEVNGGFLCSDFNGTKPGIRSAWISQYLKDKAPDLVYSQLNADRVRLEKFCGGYPTIRTSEAIGYIFLANSNKNPADLKSTDQAATSQTPPARLSWRPARYNSNGRQMNYIAVDNEQKTDKYRISDLAPGFHKINYACSWSNGGVDNLSLDIFVKPDFEYYLAVSIHGDDEYMRMSSMEVQTHHNVKTSPTPGNRRQICSAAVYECQGAIYIDRWGNKLSCLKEKKGLFNTLMIRDDDQSVM